MHTQLRRVVALALVLGVSVGIGACETDHAFRPVNHAPTVLSLIAFPTTIGPGDSAIVVCYATDSDGDTVVYDWSSDCRLVKAGAGPNDYGLFNRYDRSLVVHAGACVSAPVDTGWVVCEVRDRKGGGAYAGYVRIIVQQ